MFNKSEIMRRAWQIVKNADVAKFGYKFLLRRALRHAWGEAKAAIAMAKITPVEEMTPVQRAIVILESKTRWTREDYARHDALTAKLRGAAQ